MAVDLAARGKELSTDRFVGARSALEASVIAGFITELGLSTYIDVGCWYGFLMREVLARCSPRRVIGVDAVPEFLNAARLNSRGASGTVEFRRAIVVPGAHRGPAVLRIDEADSSRSGLHTGGDRVIDDAPARTIVDLLSDLEPTELGAAYLKLDLEGVDEQVVADLLIAGLRPGALEFEVLGRGYRDPGTMERLGAAGYAVRPLDGGHPYWSVTCSKDRCVVVGFKPDTVYA